MVGEVGRQVGFRQCLIWLKLFFRFALLLNKFVL